MTDRTQTQHTPEPWELDERDRISDIADGSGFHAVGPFVIVAPDEDGELAVVAEIQDDVPGGLAEANASRIVACVNACAGLDPAAIPALVAAAERVIDRTPTSLEGGTETLLDLLHENREALRAALQTCKGANK